MIASKFGDKSTVFLASYQKSQIISHIYSYCSVLERREMSHLHRIQSIVEVNDELTAKTRNDTPVIGKFLEMRKNFGISLNLH